MGELAPDLQQCMRFSPSNKMAIDILISKITGNCKGIDFIFEAGKCNLEPWDLKNLCVAWLDLCGITMYPEWWCFLLLDRIGKALKRATESGFWKVTGQPMKFMSDSGLIGKKDILVFYMGHGKEAKKTNWVMHQYLVTLNEFDGSHPGQSPFVLCRLSYKDKESAVENFNSVGLAVPSGLPALEVQATKTLENFGKTISTTITPVDCDGKSFSAHAAENQVGELTATEDDLQQDEASAMIYVDCEILAPSPSLHNNSAFSFPTTAKSSLEELESRQALALVSPSSEEQSNNYLAKCHPEETFDGTNFNTTTLSNCNQNGYNATSSELQEGFGFSDLLKPLDCNLFSPLTSDMHNGMSYSVSNNHCGTDSLYGVLMKDNGSYSGSAVKMANEPFQEGFSLSDLQKPLDCYFSSPLTSDMHIGMSYSVNNDYNHCGTYSQYVTNELPKFGYKFSNLTSDYRSENFPNTFDCQKNLPLDSMKDNGSCSGLDAKLANALLESTFQGSGETSKRKASSGLLNLESHMVPMGGSANQIVGSDCIPKNY
ncbi:hypothetical protein F2P56_030870 [Juglans regia]|uniref:NAC domain-containing protein n=2 Tax=Juglans regia TaxID=51240 RepID=A0A833TLY9_JUGRE|nr:NAC domain-containing protein 91-like [Juglans regia]KAF5450531.1 hypothetical protein F2P56_030870 [Juglans regia]